MGRVISCFRQTLKEGGKVIRVIVREVLQEIYKKVEEKMRQAERLSLKRPERKAAISSIASSIQAVAGGGT